MKESNKRNPFKRILKVYSGYYCSSIGHRYKTHPVIRLEGIYLAAIDFQIGDKIEVIAEKGRIIITKKFGENM
jgi:hypothetical protein